MVAITPTSNFLPENDLRRFSLRSHCQERVSEDALALPLALRGLKHGNGWAAGKELNTGIGWRKRIGDWWDA